MLAHRTQLSNVVLPRPESTCFGLRKATAKINRRAMGGACASVAVSLFLIAGQTAMAARVGVSPVLVPPARAADQGAKLNPTLGLSAPVGAIQLFDGSSTAHFDSDARITEDGHLAAGATTARAFQDFRLHVEFRIPYRPDAEGQDRGNSGVYLQRRYEVQILDSFGTPPQIDGCAAIYRQRKPVMNVCLPPLAWQTYDIDFTAARFNAQGVKVTNARITVRHNGVVVHDDVELQSKTGAGQPEGPDPLPIYFQDHGNLVTFRNIWILEKTVKQDAGLLATNR